MAESRRFCFTQFNIDFDYSNIGETYLYIGLENCPTTGREHHQGYIEFANQTTVKALSKKLIGANIRICKGTAQENESYCGKNGVIVVERGKAKRQGKRNDLLAIKEKIENGVERKVIAAEHFGSWVRYNKAFDLYATVIHETRRDENIPKNVIIIFGASGTGKTSYARERGGEIVKFDGKFYSPKVVYKSIIFDEIDKPDSPWGKSELLQVTDRYNIDVNIKGGWANLGADTIYLIGNNHYREWKCYDKGLERRITDVIQLVEETTQKLITQK